MRVLPIPPKTARDRNCRQKLCGNGNSYLFSETRLCVSDTPAPSPPRRRGLGWIGFRLPLDHRRAPRESRAEHDQEDQVAAMNASRSHGFIERDGHRSGGGVAVFVEIDEHLFGFGPEPLPDGINNAAVG